MGLERPDRPRIFGIGLNKTGTTSFHRAMTMLGFESLHWGGPPVRKRVEAAADAGEPLLARLDPCFDAFSDIEALSTRFRLLDEQYPGSHFVLTVRPIDDWLDSRRRHVENNVRKQAAGEYDGNFLTVDEDQWRAHWVSHIARVRNYFAGRDDFLEIDITNGGSWRPFTSLLGVAEPDAPFPWVNRASVDPGQATGSDRRD